MSNIELARCSPACKRLAELEFPFKRGVFSFLKEEENAGPCDPTVNQLNRNPLHLYLIFVETTSLNWCPLSSFISKVLCPGSCLYILPALERIPSWCLDHHLDVCFNLSLHRIQDEKVTPPHPQCEREFPFLLWIWETRWS